MLTIAGIEIGGNNPCRFIAELSNNANGSLERALRLVAAAKEAGADFVKLQCYTPDELIALRGDGPAPEPWASQGFTMRTLYEKAATPWGWFPHIFQRAHNLGMVPFSSVFGAESLAFLENVVRCPAYKIARLDNGDRALRAAVTATGKPVIISCYGDSAMLSGDLRLYCPPGYPQTEFGFGAKLFANVGYGLGHPYHGFSYHGISATPCIVAATLGAKLIEAHFHIGGDESSELESDVSLSPSEFERMVYSVRDVEVMLG